LDFKLGSCHRQLSLFPVVIITLPASSQTFLPMMSKANKLPLGTDPVAFDNNTSWMLKPGHQTFIVPYLTDNHSKSYASH